MLSDALFEEIVGSCPTELSVLPDCMQLTTLPECGVVPPSYNSDRLRLSSMRPGDCTRAAVASTLRLPPKPASKRAVLRRRRLERDALGVHGQRHIARKLAGERTTRLNTS